MKEVHKVINTVHQGGRDILAFVVDCEEGNKKAMTEMEDEQDNGTVDPELALCVLLPDSLHVGKSLKASFANWYLKLSNERGNLSMLNPYETRRTQR